MKDNMYDLYSSHLVRVGEILEGTVVSVTERCIYLDLNTFTEGKMYLNHFSFGEEASSFSDIVKVGDVIKCEVTKVDESEILLSRLNLVKREAFNEFANSEVDQLTVQVVRKVNRGYICNGSNVQFFLPEREVESSVKIGDTFEVKVLNIDTERGNALVSKRALDRENYQSAKQQEFDSINKDDVLTGEIANIESYGIFVKFKYNNGLIRLKEIDHIYVSNPNDNFKVGDAIEVKVIGKENGKIDLSRKALIKSPFELFLDEHKISDVVKCKVVQKLPFGVVCQLAENVNGLLHISEFSWNPNDNLMASLKIGDEIELAIIKTDAKKRSIGLSRKALIDNPWSRVEAKIGDAISGKIKEITSKGLIIDTLGVDAFIPSNEVVLEKKSSKLEDYFNVGDEINAVIVELDTKAWVLNASAKKYQNRIEKEHFSEYIDKQNEETVGTTLGDLFEEVLKK